MASTVTYVANKKRWCLLTLNIKVLKTIFLNHKIMEFLWLLYSSFYSWLVLYLGERPMSLTFVNVFPCHPLSCCNKRYQNPVTKEVNLFLCHVTAQKYIAQAVETNLPFSTWSLHLRCKFPFVLAMGIEKGIRGVCNQFTCVRPIFFRVKLKTVKYNFCSYPIDKIGKTCTIESYKTYWKI